jgi:hypothetical protein
MRALHFATTVVLVLALASQMLATRRMGDQNRYLVELVAREVAAERLLGKEASAYLTGLLPEDWEQGSYLLFWIVAPERCDDCLRFTEAWRRLHLQADLERLVVVAGSPDALDESVVEELRAAGTTIRRATSDLLAQRFSFPFQSLRILVSPAGEILLADGRPPDAQCRWSFEALVARFLRSDIYIPFAVSREG